MDRYSRQSLLRVIGSRGQKKIDNARIAVVGLGALGSAAAQCLARAGVGEMILIDRDILELSNLQRQLLYDESDVDKELPKAVAAKQRLSEINSAISLHDHAESLHAGNIRILLEGVQLIIDGTDNVETRYLLNDYSVSNDIPWIYGGAIGTNGTGLFVVPGEGPCLRCIFPDPPDAEKLGTCDTVGVLGTVPVIIGAWQASMAIRFIVGGREGLGERIFMVDLWEHGFQEPVVKRRKECPACGKGDFPFLRLRKGTVAVSLCGRGAYQVNTAGCKTIKLEEISKRLNGLGEVDLGPYYLRFSDGRAQMFLFRSGEAQIRGVGSENEALSFYARYVGL